VALEAEALHVVEDILAEAEAVCVVVAAEDSVKSVG